MVLIGCASETVRPAKVALPAAYEAPASSQDVRPSPVVLDRWWTLYDDEQLTGLVDTALAGAPDAEAAKARLREALGVRDGALTGYGPQGDINGQVASTKSRQLSGNVVSIPGLPPGTGFSGQSDSRTGSASLNVSWELDLFGRRRAARQSADADLAAAHFDAAASRASLAANVADALFAARGLAIQLEDARETARITRTLAESAHAKLEQGLVASSDADQAQAEAAQAEAQVDDLRGQLQTARRSLLILVGRGTDPLAGLEVPASAGLPPAVPAAVPGELLARRPDVREAAERLRSEAGALKLDELALLPTVKLIPNADVSKLEQTGFSSATAAWSVGAGLLMPLLSRPRLMAQLHAQGAKADLAVVTYEKTVQIAFGEAENALAQLAEDRARTWC